MSTYRQAAHFDAPVECVWELVGNPQRHPEWWPRVVEVRGERFEEGDEYAQVTRGPVGSAHTNFLVERRADLHEVRLRCQHTGMYACWVLTEAQGGTFVELEMGMDPTDIGPRLFDATAGRLYFRRWSTQSLEALRDASTAEARTGT